jgi:uncharacterized YigZ family protein
MDKIITIKNFHEYRLKEKGSLFIGQAFPINSISEAGKILGQVKKKYFDASHICFAYKINNQIKYSDAGEPSGTAGIRILNAVDHFTLSEIILIVIRYFGGTKLGAGPLGKAYYNTAYGVLNESELITKRGHKKFSVSINYSLVNSFYHLVSFYEGLIKQSSSSAEKLNIELLVIVDSAEEFILKLKDLSKGEVIITSTEKIFYE